MVDRLIHKALQGRAWSAPEERLAVQIIHWGVVLAVVLSVSILSATGHLDKASTTALFGTVIGHAGTSASQKLSERSSDHAHASPQD